LAWINLSHYFEPDVNLTRYFGEHGGVLLEGGDMFIADGEGHIRVNFACPRATLEEGLKRIIAAVPTTPAG
jgi:cystathionine beta-lyase